MSSDLKDARWAIALKWVGEDNKKFEDFTYYEWQSLLDEAQRELDKWGPDLVDYWAKEFRREDD